MEGCPRGVQTGNDAWRFAFGDCDRDPGLLESANVLTWGAGMVFQGALSASASFDGPPLEEGFALRIAEDVPGRELLPNHRKCATGTVNAVFGLGDNGFVFTSDQPLNLVHLATAS